MRKIKNSVFDQIK